MHKPLNRLKFSAKHLKHIKRFICLTALTAAVAAGLSCGKRKPPLPPVERVPQRAEMNGFQRGSKILLSWKMPARNAKEDDLLHIERIEVYRLAEPLSSPLNMTEAEFSSRAVVIASVPVDDDDFAFKTMTYADALEFATQPVRLRYAVRFVNKSGQRAAFSNFLVVEPAAGIADNPRELKLAPSQEAIKLDWDAPAANVDGTTPVNLIGYNVYRSEDKDKPARLLTKTPISATNYDDIFFDFDKTYFYFVRAVSIGTNAEPVESGETAVVEITPKDTFAPKAPEGLTVAASTNSVAIFFAVNTENDIAGYTVYRSENKDAPLGEWQKLTPELIKTNTFQDTTAVNGKQYFYYVTATDLRGNVSEPSGIVSETPR
jgi:hypothetical protein